MSHYLDFLYQSEKLTEHPDFLDNTATPPERQFQVYVMENNGHEAKVLMPSGKTGVLVREDSTTTVEFQKEFPSGTYLDRRRLEEV